MESGADDRRGTRKAWLLALASVVYAVAFVLFALTTSGYGPAPAWDMGGHAFVPASGPSAEGYFLPVRRVP